MAARNRARRSPREPYGTPIDKPRPVKPAPAVQAGAQQAILLRLRDDLAREGQPMELADIEALIEVYERLRRR
jgi:hypothetical protein